jgi:hypothetical protein
MSERVTLRRRIEAFFSPAAPVYFLPADIDEAADRYMAAGWDFHFYRRDPDLAKHFGRWRLWVSQEVKTSGCEKIVCTHDSDGDTMTEAIRKLDALNILAPEPAAASQRNGGTE